MVNENIPMKSFVGLAVDEKAPDHSTLTAFKERLGANEGTEVLEQILREIVRMAQEKGGLRVGAGDGQPAHGLEGSAEGGVRPGGEGVRQERLLGPG